MELGLKRGFVKLSDHQICWKQEAEKTIKQLKDILGNIIIDIQHIGSTSIKDIKAKPIIDIAIGIKNFDNIDYVIQVFDQNGIIYRPNENKPEFKVFVMGNMIEQIRTHHIHVVIHGSNEWNNYINFRDYLNKHHLEAKKYEELKIKLMEENKDNRANYTQNKEEFIKKIYEKARK